MEPKSNLDREYTKLIALSYKVDEESVIRYTMIYGESPSTHHWFNSFFYEHTKHIYERDKSRLMNISRKLKIKKLRSI